MTIHMARKRRRLTDPLLFACLLWSLATASGASGVDEIVNYRQYSDTLASSGQPTEAQLQSAAEAGYERIVYLAFSDHDESLANEDRVVKKLGMEYAHIPVDWEAPQKSDFYMFAGLMVREPGKRTLVHCQVNFRASTFSFLYRVLYLDVAMDLAKQDLESVWVPNDTWRRFIFDVLEDNDRSPFCDACLWEPE